MLDPVPRYPVCSHLFLPGCHRPSPSKNGSASRASSHELRLLAGPCL